MDAGPDCADRNAQCLGNLGVRELLQHVHEQGLNILGRLHLQDSGFSGASGASGVPRVPRIHRRRAALVGVGASRREDGQTHGSGESESERMPRQV